VERNSGKGIKERITVLAFALKFTLEPTFKCTAERGGKIEPLKGGEESLRRLREKTIHKGGESGRACSKWLRGTPTGGTRLVRRSWLSGGNELGKAKIKFREPLIYEKTWGGKTIGTEPKL